MRTGKTGRDEEATGKVARPGAPRSRRALLLATLIASFSLLGLLGPLGLGRLLVVVPLSFTLVGGFVARFRPCNPTGWLFLAFGAVGGFTFTAGRYAALQNESLPATDLAAALAEGWWHSGFCLFEMAFLLFPNGSLPSPRWRPVALAVAGVGLVLFVTGPFDHRFISEMMPGARPILRGPLVTPLSLLHGLALFSMLGLFVISGASLVVRLRRSTGEERQQIKWFSYSVGAVAVLFPISIAIVGNGSIGIFLIPLIPVSAALAILKYRLYDIDVVVHRTLVYGALTAVLGLTYAAGVVLLGRALDPLTEESDLAVAGSTLAVAALFRPVRTRLQSVIDRRFNRRRYDAQRTLDGFALRLRDEVDLDSLASGLIGAIDETMQPAHASLWLRGEVGS
jgi:hypothetical protein